MENPGAAVLNADAQKITAACKHFFEANKDNCSGFVKAVAASFGIRLIEPADNMVHEIQGPGWTVLADGVEAKQKAEDGWFVIAGLEGHNNVPPHKHGHVVVVVTGQLAHDKYPTGYWGRLGGVGKEDSTINNAWNKASRDKVIYSGRPL